MGEDPKEPANAPAATKSPEAEDLGFGRVLTEQVRGRFLNKDGTPNSRKYGMGSQLWQKLQLRALYASWPAFFAWLFGLLLLVNGMFALAYVGIGPAALAGVETLQLPDAFTRAFAFSIGVFTTVGTGPMHAVGATANWLVTFESLLGPILLLGSGGFLIARLSRPRASIRFSHSAVMAPYKDGRGFMFRLINTQPSELIDVEVRLNVALYETVDGKRQRKFHPLIVDRKRVEFFTLHWTVVHPITPDSPLAGFTRDQVREAEAEFFVFIAGLEETFSTRVHARTSYVADEVRWDAKFADMFVSSPDGIMTVDAERLDRFDRLPEGSTATPSPSER